MTAPRLLLTAAVGALILAGCGDGGGGSASSSSSSTTSKASTTLTVKETEFALAPANPKVAKAGSVRITARNAGTVAHALEVEGPNGEARTGSISPGRSATLTLDLSKPGKYEWYCPIDGHKDKGMKGAIVVAGGGSGGTSTGESGDDNGGSRGGSGY
jgi:plastocyanin